MKNILKIIAIFVFSFIWTTNFAQAEWQTVKVTEKIPGIGCTYQSSGEDKWYYYCNVDWWVAGFYKTIQWILKYFTFLVVLTWVLFIVINWIAISMSWVDSWAKEAAKWRIMKTIGGLILLLLSWVILNLIAPWVYEI
jgi:hypothetical protein